jgi:hypothetical protein
MSGKNRIGRLQSIVRRCLIEAGGEPVATGVFARRAFPHVSRFEYWQYNAITRAARRFAVRVGRSPRGHGRPAIWQAKPELLRLILGDDAET